MASSRVRDSHDILLSEDDDGPAVPVTGSNGHLDSESVEIDFSQEPIFDVSGQGVRRDIPGLRGSYIVVKSGVDYRISSGRNQFARQTQRIVRQGGKARPDDSIDTSYDIFSLFVYKVENCLEEVRIEQNGVVQHVIDDRRKMVRLFTPDLPNSVKSEKLCQWISDQIDEVLGWNAEEEDRKKKFPAKA